MLFPQEWSLKSQDNNIPHNSSLQAIALEAQTTETHTIESNDCVKAVATKGRQRKERAKIHKSRDDFQKL